MIKKMGSYVSAYSGYRKQRPPVGTGMGTQSRRRG